MVNPGSNTVSVLDAHTGAVRRTVPGGVRPLHVAMDARTGRAFVPGIAGATVSILDTRTGTVLRTLHTGRYGAVPAALSHTLFLQRCSAGALSAAATGYIPSSDTRRPCSSATC